jgi:hypothetical protein
MQPSSSHSDEFRERLCDRAQIMKGLNCFDRRSIAVAFYPTLIRAPGEDCIACQEENEDVS